MANTQSAEKRLRQSKKQNYRNQQTKKSLKNILKKADAAESDSQRKEMASELAATIDTAAKKGVLHKNKAARLKSRYMKAQSDSAKS